MWITLASHLASGKFASCTQVGLRVAGDAGAFRPLGAASVTAPHAYEGRGVDVSRGATPRADIDIAVELPRSQTSRFSGPKSRSA